MSWFPLSARAPAFHLPVLLALILGSPCHGEEVDYTRDIRPILTDMCFACHGADSATRAADLRLDQLESALEYDAIVPGDAAASEMIARIESDDPDTVMPPPETKKTVTEKQKQTLIRWINQGGKYQEHWSFAQPKIETPKKTTDSEWRKSPIDDYVASKLDELGLQPAPEADPDTLFRRLHLDITGLPPSPEERLAFVDEYAAEGDVAYSRWIDRLMSRPAWGEHRGRYWLDAARYGDTHGLHFDNYREMWPYRDWVIRAFNRNMPFDQFMLEQIAGDLLDDPSESQLIATGFQRCNITTNEGGTIDEENLANYAADRVQTFGWVFLGLTTNCAQCHDHKFDPITQKDYYSLAAYFRNTTQGPKDGNRKDGRGPILYVPSDLDRPRYEVLPTEIAAAEKARDQHRNSVNDAFDRWAQSIATEDIDAKIPSSQLVTHLPLDEGKGNDLAIQGEWKATLHLEQPLEWKKTPGHSAAPVVGKDAPIRLGPLGTVSATDAFSLSAFINVPPKGTGGLIAKMDVGSEHRGWDLYRQGNALSVHLIDRWPGNALKVTTRDNVLRPGKWQHVTATYDGSGKASGIKIYVGGNEMRLRTEAETLKPGASFLTDVPLQIGSRSSGAPAAGLSVSDLRFYRRTLTKSEASVLVRADHIKRLIAKRDAEKQWGEKERQALKSYYLDSVDPTYPGLVQQVAALTAEKFAIEARSPITHIQQERKDSPAMAHMLVRGQYDQKGDEVSAATPAALHPMPDGAPNNRLGLARWVIDPANPLTHRVTVNRFWQEVFGRGLVPTSEDFGITGTLPANPELLDFLAVDFQQSGWDVKRFFKQIFMSAAYRQAAVTTPEKLLHDRDNAYLSRGPRFRMDAEMVRDAALKVSGLLSPRMFGPGVKPYQPIDIWNIVGLPGSDTRNYKRDSGEGLYRRTVYSFWKRMAPPPNMEALNAPSREVCVVRRERTNTPLQALVTLNDPQFVEAARHLAQAVLMEPAEDESQRLRRIAQRALCRDATDAELKVMLASLGEFKTYYDSNPEDAKKFIAVGETKPTDAIDPQTLAAWTLVCNQILNLDEVVCK